MQFKALKNRQNQAFGPCEWPLPRRLACPSRPSRKYGTVPGTRARRRAGQPAAFPARRSYWDRRSRFRSSPVLRRKRLRVAWLPPRRRFAGVGGPAGRSAFHRQSFTYGGGKTSRAEQGPSRLLEAKLSWCVSCLWTLFPRLLRRCEESVKPARRPPNVVRLSP